MKRQSVSCIVLAGGQARRFNNEDKGLVKFNGKPLIEHVIHCLQLQVDDIIISANRNIDIYKQYASQVITDTLDGYQGPLAGISSALPHCKHPLALVVPCDTPLLPENLVERLEPSSPEKIHVASSDGHHQLVFLIHKDLLPSLNQYIEQGLHKVMDWVTQQNPLIVEIGEFANLNTPDDLKQLTK